MSKAYLFYGTQLVAELESQETSSQMIRERFGQEIYNGGYMYYPVTKTNWWRCDMTPCLIEHVPKELRALALLLT
jgi:phage pi2 protein 07